MKQELNPRILIPVILVGVLVLAFVGYRVWSAPSVVPAPAAVGADSSGTAAARGSGLQGVGGPPPEALRKREEYNQAHPEAVGSR